LTTLNAMVEWTASSDRPSAAANTCSKPPVAVPMHDAKPSARPPAIVRVTM
jgi:hypothetical protein